jgi:hypothetical protein
MKTGTVGRLSVRSEAFFLFSRDWFILQSDIPFCTLRVCNENRLPKAERLILLIDDNYP